MKQQTEDRRSRKTKALIRQTLIELLLTQELKDISVSEVAARADINRGTFYLHYRDAYDVFERLEQEVLEEFTAFIEKYIEHPAMMRISVLLDLFRYIAANASVFTVILHTKEATFLERIIEDSRPQSAEEWVSVYGGADAENYGYTYEFVAYGCVAMLKRWFEGGMKESPDQMAELALKMMTGSITEQ